MDRPHGGRQCLRLIYRYPGLPATRYLTVWQNNLRYVGREIAAPEAAARLRFWLRVERAAPGAKLQVYLLGRDFGAKGFEAWGWAFDLPPGPEAAGAPDAAGWRLAELPLDAPRNYWSPETGEGAAADHPLARGRVTAIRFALSDADAEFSLDDLRFVTSR